MQGCWMACLGGTPASLEPWSAAPTAPEIHPPNDTFITLWKTIFQTSSFTATLVIVGIPLFLKVHTLGHPCPRGTFSGCRAVATLVSPAEAGWGVAGQR